jgi:hypothetical protein
MLPAPRHTDLESTITVGARAEASGAAAAGADVSTDESDIVTVILDEGLGKEVDLLGNRAVATAPQSATLQLVFPKVPIMQPGPAGQAQMSSAVATRDSLAAEIAVSSVSSDTAISEGVIGRSSPPASRH